MHALVLAVTILHNISVIDGTGAPARVADVVIEGERIKSVAAHTAHPHDAEVIDGSGQYVVPGFVDMHAHVFEHRRDDKGNLEPRFDRETQLAMLELLLRFGVTTIRDPGSETEAAVTLRRMLNERKVKGPRLFTAGRILNQSSFSPEPFTPVKTADDVRREIAWQAAAGVDFIKIYSSMRPDLAKVAIDEAHAHGLPVIGHLQRTTWTEAANDGIDFIAHGAPWSPEYLPAEKRAAYEQDLFGRVYWLENVDVGGPQIGEMIDTLVRHRVVMDPTLIAYHTKFFGNDRRWLDNPDNALIPQYSKTWKAASFTRDWTPSQFAQAQRAWPKQLALIRRLYDAGVRLTVGTDTPTPWIVPGASVHDEMALLADAGIPPAAILRMATSDAAAALKGDFGRIAAGLSADLVVLSKDPLVDIRNTRSIVAVFARGQRVAETKKPAL